MDIIIITAAIILTLVLIYIGLRNRLITLKNKVEYANGSVEHHAKTTIRLNTKPRNGCKRVYAI